MNNRNRNFQDGAICYINFGSTSIGGEINAIHMAVFFNIPGIDNVILVIPLTSPKEKHFRSNKAFLERNYLETKFLRLHYIKQTDSIALLEQLKSVSIKRIINTYKGLDHKDVILNQKELKILKMRIKKYIDFVLK